MPRPEGILNRMPDAGPRESPPVLALDRTSREIRFDGRRIRLADKPFRVLEALVDAAGGVVTREALRRILWSDDTFVDFDNNLNSAVATLRQALGDSARAPRAIETIPKVGYRLIVTPIGEAAAAAGREPPRSDARAARRRSRGLTALAAGLAAAVVADAALFHPHVTPVPESRQPAAQAAFERARYLRAAAGDGASRAAGLTAAREAFARAAALDPSFAPARAEEADTTVELAFAGALEFRSALADARRQAARAAALDARSATAARVLASADLYLDWNFRSAERGFRRAWRLAPDDARTSLALAAYLSAAGRHREALSYAREAVRRDPDSTFVRADLAFFSLAAGLDEDAARESRDVLAAAPGFAPAQHHALVANARLGRWTEAAGLARQLLESSGGTADDLAAFDRAAPRDAVTMWRRWALERAERDAVGREDAYALDLALRHAALGHDGRALDWLERAFARRTAMLVFLRAFPELAALRGTPRFEALAARLES
jgi:DNA-binding winged helix-turn-helix (wHTH) protein/Tfp pilus assembly protein PilF